MGRLSEERREALRALCPGLLDDGEVGGSSAAPCLYEGRWGVALRRVELFAAAHGHAAVPATYGADPELGRWAEGVRAAAAAGELGAHERASLRALGFEWCSEAAARAVVAPAPQPAQASALEVDSAAQQPTTTARWVAKGAI